MGGEGKGVGGEWEGKGMGGARGVGGEWEGKRMGEARGGARESTKKLKISVVLKLIFTRFLTG